MIPYDEAEVTLEETVTFHIHSEIKMTPSYLVRKDTNLLSNKGMWNE